LALTISRELIPAESGAVILEERGYLRFTAVSGPHARKLVGVRLPLGTGVAGFSMEMRRAVVLGDAHEDPRHCGEVDALTGYVTKEIAVLPVVYGGSVFGVLELMNLAAGRRFSQADVRELEHVAAALGKRLSR
jgi:putative methionine-R-sulfoxide reductase with GAF domain